MTLPVYLTDRAQADVDSTCQWWAENRTAQQALRWLNEFDESLKKLCTDPMRFPLARENSRLSVELRQMNFGLSGKRTHRVVFTIRPDMILILRLRHLAQQELSEYDL